MAPSLLCLTSGCGIARNTADSSGPSATGTVHGSVYGGQQPVLGATIQLYAAGSTTDGGAATALISAPVLSSAGGAFDITGLYHCPSSTTPVYLTATGGNPGLTAGTMNAALAMMTALGPCGNLTSSTTVSINELTTVASVYALSPFMTSYANVGASPAHSAALAAAFASVNQSIDTASGTSPGPSLPAGYAVQTGKLNTFADILAACINSAGGSAGDTSPCGRLFTAATPPTGAAPANTLDATLSVALNPTRNVQALFNQTASSAPFQPSLSAAPPDWTLPLLPQLSLQLPSPLIAAGTTLTGTLTLGQAAPTGGLSAALTSSNPNAVTTSTPVIVPAGATSGSFSYQGLASGAATLTAAATNYASGTAAISATSGGLQVSAVPTLAPGQQSTLTIALNGPVQTATTVSLTTGNSSVATVSPTSVTIPAGSARASVTPSVTGVGIGTTQITAIASGYAPGVTATNVTVTASFSGTVSPKVGSAASAVLSISAAAPTGGVTFSLSTDNAAIASVPSSVTVPQGATTANVPVTGVAPGTTVLRAKSANIADATATISASPTQSQAIKHVVVIFDENVSFDHYFATYPHATNPSGEPTFTPAAGTPAPAGLSGALLTANPNSTNTTNGGGAANPFRIDRAQAATADQDHAYHDEQIAFDGGAMDLFPYSVGVADSAALASQTGAPSILSTNALTMGYFDGNTVTALWNYAQHYSLADHFFATMFGQSTPGALNLISGQTNGVVNDAGAYNDMISDGSGGYSLFSDPDPTGDLCSNGSRAAHMSGRNVGDLLTAANTTWGFFSGGFDLSLTNSNGTTGCSRTSIGTTTGATFRDYIPHHQPFQYYASTANPNHVRPTSASAIGTNADAANHQYDLHDFYDAMAAGNMPAVSFLKPIATQDGHAGYSNPLDEQIFLVNAVNAIQQSAFWQNTAILIAYDDSDGWYDHLYNVVNASQSTQDAFTSAGVCGVSAGNVSSTLPGVASSTAKAQGRCGYGPRLPLLVLSPWAKRNAVDSTVTDQTSILRFIEDTFLAKQRIGAGSFDSIAGPLDNAFDFSAPSAPNSTVVVLDPVSGQVTSAK